MYVMAPVVKIPNEWRAREYYIHIHWKQHHKHASILARTPDTTTTTTASLMYVSPHIRARLSPGRRKPRRGRPIRIRATLLLPQRRLLRVRVSWRVQMELEASLPRACRTVVVLALRILLYPHLPVCRREGEMSCGRCSTSRGGPCLGLSAR